MPHLINTIRLALDKVLVEYHRVPPHKTFLLQHNGRVDCVGSTGIVCCSVFVRGLEIDDEM